MPEWCHRGKHPGKEKSVGNNVISPGQYGFWKVTDQLSEDFEKMVGQVVFGCALGGTSATVLMYSRGGGVLGPRPVFGFCHEWLPPRDKNTFVGENTDNGP